jgi:hypothetical protein
MRRAGVRGSGGQSNREPVRELAPRLFGIALHGSAQRVE